MKKFVGCLLLSAVLLLSAAGCRQEQQPPADTGNTTTGEEVSREDSVDPNLPAIDGEGRQIRFLVRESGTSANYWYEEIVDSGESADIVENAVFQRNDYLCQKYSIDIVSKVVNNNQLEDEIERQVFGNISSAEGGFDIAVPMLVHAANQAVQGNLYSIDHFPVIDPEKPYWFGDIYYATTVSNTNYFIAGDVNTSVYGSSWTTFFNEKLVADNQIQNPYDLVKQNNWTLETMLELARQYGQDKNSDGVYDTSDEYGICSGTWVWQCFFYGSDLRLIDKDSDDIPYVTVGDASQSEIMQNVLSQTVEIMNTQTLAINSNAAGLSQQPSQLFCQDQVLFYFANVNNAFIPGDIKDMSSEYGMLPLPKYNSQQQYYSNAVHPHHSSCMAVPGNIREDLLPLLGSLLEDMAYYSYVYVKPNYYDQVVTVRTSRNDRSYEMMPYIFEHYTIDFGLIMTDTFGFDNEIRNRILTNRSSFADYFTQYKGIWEIALGDIVSTYGQRQNASSEEAG